MIYKNKKLVSSGTSPRGPNGTNKSLSSCVFKQSPQIGEVAQET